MTAYFVITHGSRFPRSVLGRQRIEKELKEICPQIKIGGGCLEGQTQTLQEQMIDFAKDLTHREKILAIPLFLLKGIHTQVDIPGQIPDDRWQLTALLGEHPSMAELLNAQFPSRGGRILLCHGSNYGGAVREFENLARSIDAQPLTWQQIQQEKTDYQREFHVLPYFLANSYILDKIKADFSDVNLLPTPLTPPVVASMAKELAEGLNE